MKWAAYQKKLGKPGLRILKKADYDAWQRRAKSKQRMQAAAGVCLIVVLASFAAALTWAVAGLVLR